MENNQSNLSQYGTHWETWVYVSTFPFVLLVVVIIIIGNSLVLVSVWRFQYLKTPTFILLAWLALADLSVGITAPPNMALLVAPQLHHCSTYCNIVTTLILPPFVVSNILLIGK